MEELPPTYKKPIIERRSMMGFLYVNLSIYRIDVIVKTKNP